MFPEYRTKFVERKLERSKIRFVGISFTMVGMLMLFITFITGGKVSKDYGLLLLLSPFFVCFGIGFVFGLMYFVVNATKTFIENVILFYSGYDYDDLKNKLK